MTTALVINCSALYYNLGAAKLVQWLRTTGVEVTAWEGDPGLFGGSPERVYLSVIFSWHAPWRVIWPCGTGPMRMLRVGARGCSPWRPGGGSRPGSPAIGGWMGASSTSGGPIAWCLRRGAVR